MKFVTKEYVKIPFQKKSIIISLIKKLLAMICKDVEFFSRKAVVFAY